MGPLVVKNRDYRGEHVQLQRVFLHRDPARPGEAVLCVGSLGSPGAFSSGMNAHGLALVDTHVSTRDHGPGLLRYFLMTRLLWRCRNVEEALRMIAGLPHAGGGSIVLGDKSGACAAVELGHSAWSAETSDRYVLRTNHFVSRECGSSWLAPDDEKAVNSTKGRHARLQSWLRQRTACPSFDDVVAIMSSHPEHGQESLCRHGEYGDSHTISCSVFAPADGRLYFSAGKPCSGPWHSLECRP
jgi:isopenicillin-N N-acyltransferase-like protein